MGSTLIILVLGLILLNGWMYLQQPSMVFFPYDRITETPKDWGFDYEEVFLETGGPRLHGWFIPHADAEKTVLFFHGNAGNIAHRGDSVAIFHRLGLNVFIFDYRGYGRSEGSPGEQGLYEDALAAWAYLTGERGLAGEDIILFGRSLGGVVATRLASEVQPLALIIESAFSSARSMADDIFPLLSRLVLLRFDFDAEAAVKKVLNPVLVMHSPDDEIIPYKEGRKVFAAANEPKQFFTLKGDHNYGFLRSQPEYEQALGAFIDSL